MTKVMIVLQSPRKGAEAGAEALPPESPSFREAIRKWGVDRGFLLAAVRANALDADPAGGGWERRAVERVRRLLAEHEPQIVVAAGRVAAIGVTGALGLAVLPKFRPTLIRNRLLLAVHHPSGRCRRWNDERAMEAAHRAFRALPRLG